MNRIEEIKRIVLQFSVVPERNSSTVAALLDHIEYLLAALEDARADRDAAEWGYRLADALITHGCVLKDENDYVFCAYCDWKYRKDTPERQDIALKEHISKCPNHPMRRLERENAELRVRVEAMLDALQAASTEFHRLVRDGIDVNPYTDQEVDDLLRKGES